MEKRTSWIIIALLIAQLLAMAAAPAFAGEEAPEGAYSPDSITLNTDQMHEVIVLGQKMQDYLAVNKDGTLSLTEVDTAAVNVSDEYVDNYKAALGYINAAIEQGLFTVDENFQVSWPEEMEQAADAAMPNGEAPEWSYYGAGHGLYVNFSYDDVRHYLPRYGLSTALSLASYCGRPYISTPYTYHFTYYRVYSYYYRYSYPYYGVWSYVPWSYLSHYRGYYYPSYRYIYYWYPYRSYWYYHYCYW